MAIDTSMGGNITVSYCCMALNSMNKYLMNYTEIMNLFVTNILLQKQLIEDLTHKINCVYHKTLQDHTIMSNIK